MRMPVAVALVAMAWGCSSPSNQLPVHGTVYLDGAVLPDVEVRFYPDENSSGQGGFGKADKDGKYRIGYPPDIDGLLPGTYKVSVLKMGGPPPTEEAPPEIIDAPVRAGKGVPAKYADDQTPLRVTVVPNGAPYELKLESGKKKG